MIKMKIVKIAVLPIIQNFRKILQRSSIVWAVKWNFKPGSHLWD